MTGKKKKIFVFVMLVAIAMSPMFAAAVTGGDTGAKLDLSWIKKAVNLIVGVFAGGYVLVKAAMDIFHAVRNSSEDPNGLKKAIGGLVLNIAILAAFFFVINYVFSSATDITSITSSTSAQDGFFGGLTGALVQIGL